MRYNIIEAKEAIAKYIADNITHGRNGRPLGFIYCEGSTAYHYMMDSQCPKNYSFNYGTKIVSNFTQFKLSYGYGIGCGTKTTCISVSYGLVDGKNVLFVYPTSVEVNHNEIKDYLTEHFPDMFFIEFDINFTKCSFDNKIKEKENEK